MRNLRTSRRLAWIGVPVVLLIALVAFWNWDWFIPIVQSRALAAIGRPVTIAHLHVRLGRVVTVIADGVVVANPPDWPSDDPPFVSIRSLTIEADAWGYVRGHGFVVPMIGLDGPRVLAAETKDGTANFRLSTGGGGGGSMKIGDLRITDGNAHVVIPKLKADFNAKIDTQGDGDAAKLVVDARGTYAAQPITARLVSGALLSLRDADHPWPVELNVENGPTRVSLDGTLRDPVAFQGADVR
jgi:uncharacterized protein involved in outer membrane biogenesis